MAALAHGVPSVLLPLGADQPHNALRAERLRVASSLDAATATPNEIGRCVGTSLADDALTARCREVADEMHAQPGLEAAVSALEEAAAGPSPR